MRAQTEQLKAQAWRVVLPTPHEPEIAYALREEPPKQKPQP
jgi:hypothetical protein